MLFLSVLFLSLLFHYFICQDFCLSIKNHNNEQNNKLKNFITFMLFSCLPFGLSDKELFNFSFIIDGSENPIWTLNPIMTIELVSHDIYSAVD
jgi:hypothetical protein